MRFILNVLWLILGGLWISIGYLVASIPILITLIGIPFGIQTLKLAVLALWPFGKKVSESSEGMGCVSVIMNVIWILIGGLPICISHLLWGIVCCITIIGIPFGKQHFKLASLSLFPFGREITES